MIEGQAKSLAEIEAGMKKDLSHVRRRSSPGAVTAMARGGSPAVQGSEDQTAFNNFLASIGQTNSPEKAGFNEVSSIRCFQTGLLKTAGNCQESPRMEY